MKDLKGYTFTLGCDVARASLIRKSPFIEICTVTRIEDGKLYLDNSKQYIRFPHRLLIINHDPLIKLIDDQNIETEGFNGR